MDDKKKYQPVFPKDSDYLNARYRKFQQTLNSIDYELDYSSKEKGPNPAPSPGGLRLISPELRQRRIEYLEKTRERRVQGFKTGIDKDVSGLNDKQQETIRSRLDFETSRNGFKDYSKSDLLGVKEVPKEDKISFDYMAANHFNRYQQPDKTVVAK